MENQILPETMNKLPVGKNLVTDLKVVKQFETDWKQKLVIRDKKHFKVCNCQRDMFDKFLAEEIKIAHQQLIESGDINDEFVKKTRTNRAIHDAYNRLLDYTTSNNIFCPNEFKQVDNVIFMFASKYDLSDPRAAMIVKVVLDNLISTIRLAYSSDSDGSILINDNGGLNLNPAEQAKNKFNDSILKAIEVLDRIFEGNKNVNINISQKPVDIGDIFGDDDILDMKEFKSID